MYPRSYVLFFRHCASSMASSAAPNPAVMLDKCANCRVYNWVQPAPSILQKCGRCKIVQYCSLECQAEHWKACHKSHCSKLKVAREAWREGDEPVHIASHHPFPTTGTPEDATEALVFLALLVYDKMRQTNHPAISIKAALLKELWSKLAKDNLMIIHMCRKIFPPAHTYDEIDDCVDFTNETSMLLFDEIGDQVGLWSTLHLILDLKSDLQFFRRLYNLKELLVSVPEELWQGVDRDVGIFPSIAEQIIATFYRGSQIPPFKELLKIVCGGSLTQACTFCNSQIVVKAIVGQAKGTRVNVPSVSVEPHLSRIFHCGDKSCMEQTRSKIMLVVKWRMAVCAARVRLAENRCDFCFKLSEKVHR